MYEVVAPANGHIDLKLVFVNTKYIAVSLCRHFSDISYFDAIYVVLIIKHIF